MARWVLALDQGTTSSRSILFDHEARVVAVAQREFHQYFPLSGWVEHDADEIWSTQSQTLREVLDSAGANDADIAAVGITNQRETSVVWDRYTGEPIGRAIVWQDRRTADTCQALRMAGFETEVAQLLDCYLIPISREPNWRGCWSTYPMLAAARRKANCVSAQWTRG